MRVFDCVIFFKELDLLDLRIKELSEVVDQFVVVEATTTFSGRPKPLYFAENRDRFEAMSDRIVHVVVHDLPRFQNRWIAEIKQRNAIASGLERARDGDLVLIGDADEIPRATAVRELAPAEGDIVALEMTTYRYALNLVDSSQPGRPARALLKRTLDFVTPQEARTVHNTNVLRRAGWHFSHLAPREELVELIREKAASYAHAEHDDAASLSDEAVAKTIARNRQWWNPNGRPLRPVPVDSSFPNAVVRDQAEWAEFILPLSGRAKETLTYSLQWLEWMSRRAGNVGRRAVKK